MFKSIIIATLALSAAAFRPAPMARVSMNKLSMNAEGLAGESGPLGYFDPLGNRPINHMGHQKRVENTADFNGTQFLCRSL